MNNKKNKIYALILAGGKGERLKPLTNTVPKPMLPILGKPMIWYQLKWLEYYKIENVIILTGYKWEIIQNYLSEEKNSFNLNIKILHEETPLGRGGAFKYGLSFVPKNIDLFIALNGYEITPLNISTLLQYHKDAKNETTIVLSKLRSPFGVVKINKDNKITGFEEKAILPVWINTGIYVMNRNIENLLPKIGDHEDTTFPTLAKNGELGGYKNPNEWITVNNQKELKEAEEMITKLKNKIEWLKTLE